ncbi:MAG: ribosome small subunit-dependent GTPase A [Phycisphaerae bacterium]|nr:ribosome small subunit-dependent GTPase A [Phycisphaerae bacterium]
MGTPKKPPRAKDVTADYLAGHLDDDRLDNQQRFTQRAKYHQANKTLRTSQMRAEMPSNLEQLPIGQVTQVFSLYCEVESDGASYLCVVRKTVNKISESAVVVGDRVRFRAGDPEGVIEQVLPRATVLTRADSFKGIEQHPIVANAEQMLIVAALHRPRTKWGLIDRMLIAAQAGGLVPAVCLNKLDLVEADDREWIFAREALSHYRSMGVHTIESSVPQETGIDEINQWLDGRTTVLAGHSGVGKSSLIRRLLPNLDIKIGEVSEQTEKGRHTTTGARRYVLPENRGVVIDTPGVKLFGLWNVTAQTLDEFFPDVSAGIAPKWRSESYQRIRDSLSDYRSRR